MTEVDNIARQLPEREHQMLALAMYDLVESLVEIYVPSRAAISLDVYPRVGMADAVTIALALQERCLVLTDDLPLAGRLENLKRAVININHLRQDFLV